MVVRPNQCTSKALPNATLSPVDAAQKSFLGFVVQDLSRVNAVDDQ